MVKIRLPIFTTVLVTWIITTVYGNAAEFDCKQFPAQESIARMDRAQVTRIQLSLKDAGYDPEEIDGVIGTHTKAALQRFCENFADRFSKDFPNELINAIFLQAALSQKYPEPEEIVLDDDLKFWIYQQPAEKMAESLLILRTGTAEEIIALYRKYKSDLDKLVEDMPKSEFKGNDQQIVSYMLTESDLEKLSAKDDIVSKLEELKDKPIVGRQKFLETLNQAVAPQTIDVDNYPQDIIDLARVQTSYTITATALTELKPEKLPDSVTEDLSKLIDKEFPDKNEFVTALQPVADKVRDEFSQYQPLIIEAAREPRTYTLTEESLKVLKEKGLPDDLLDKLKTLKNRTYKDQTQFISEVKPMIEEITIKYKFPKPILDDFRDQQTKGIEEQREKVLAIIKEVTEQYHRYETLIIEEVKKLPGYRLTSATKEKLRAERVPDYINNTVHRSLDGGFSDESQFQVVLNEKVDGLIKDYRDKIIAHAETQKTYKLTDSSLNKLEQKLKDKEIPDEIIKMLGDKLVGIEYPNDYLFRHALRAKINALYMSIFLPPDSNESFFQLNEEALKEIERDLSDKKLPDGILALLQDDPVKRDRKYINRGDFQDMLYEKIQSFIRDSLNFDNKIAAFAPKNHSFREKGEPKFNPESVDWSGNNCGCVLDELSEVIIYGFYPFWMSETDSADSNGDNSDKEQEPQLLDFSVLSRIGFYALPVYNNGDLRQEHAWNRNKKVGYIKTARKYKSKVDPVIYNFDWKDWSKAGSIENFTGAIARLVKLKEDRIHIIDKIKFFLTTLPWNWTKNFYRIGTVADGITINFDGFPADLKSRAKFLDLINRLQQKLSATGRNLNLNIMVARDAIGADIFNYKDLAEILVPRNQNEDLKTNLLVFLDEPTTLSKKELRANIEKNYHGEERMEILRKIVPVITYDGRNDRQLLDDVLYCKENFGGIGFWPLPMGNEKIATDISAVVREVFSTRYEDMSTVEKTISMACNIICPNRWLFRISLDILIFLLVCFGLLFLISCRFRNYYNNSRRSFWIFIGALLLLIAIGLSLLYCDPYYKNLREGNWPLFIVIAVVIGMTVSQYFKKIRMERRP